RGLLSLGYVYFLKSEFKKAKISYEESSSLIQKNNCVRELTIFHEYSGELAFVQEDYQLAYEHYTKAIEIGEKIAPHSAIISQTYRLLADLQLAKKEYDQAFSSCQKALRVSKSLGERIEESACYRILGQIYTFRRDKEKAQEYFNKSLNIFQEINTKYELARTYLEAGKSNCFDYYERMKILGMAEDIFKELESKYHLGLIKLAQSNLFFEKQEYVSACLFLKDAEKVFRELGEEKDLNLVKEFRNKLSRYNSELEVTDSEKRYTFSQIITQNQKILDLIEQAKRIKDTDMTVLIEGETGTGKDLLAKCIHCESKRKDKKFVVTQCSAVPETLLENALFGHIKGAYTGADESSVGLFEEAAGGTLYIDEIAEIPLSTQIKLLRAIEEKEITRIGETKPKKIDVRIIASTSRNLTERVSKELFRKDLYFRLNTFNLKLLPLRERKEDILLLIEYFLKETGIAEDNLKLLDYPELIDRIQGYDWPGNIRELKNEIDKLMISTTNGEKIDPPYLLKITTSFKKVEIKKENATLYDEMDEIEKEKIKEVLEQTNYVKVKAAELLGIPVSSLKSKIKKYNILTPD
ncbi:MAG: sigma 54-interacting transcriptional regulator, partial [candidate division Zixibacteria bacterium]|nr:sigma 54-interacting transcriptional regulator [candidate division Zixibacteria bacterium]